MPCASDQWSVRHKSCTSGEFTDPGMRELRGFGYLADWLLAGRTNDNHCPSQSSSAIEDFDAAKLSGIGLPHR
jgi:hypothetical protein